MDSSNIEEEEENINVSGRLAFTKSDSIEGESDLNNKTVITLSEHFNIDRNKEDSKPIFETGKTWLSKLSSPASFSSSLGRRRSSLLQSDKINDIAASPSKPIGHWPGLLVMDKNETCSVIRPGKTNGKN